MYEIRPNSDTGKWDIYIGNKLHNSGYNTPLKAAKSLYKYLQGQS